MPNLIWSAEALDDLDRIIGYIADRNLVAAERLFETIEDITSRLPAHPLAYRSGRVAGTREAVVHPNYILIYRVGEDVIEILAVLHSRQRYP